MYTTDKSRIIIEIDEENETYQVNIEDCNIEAMRAVFQDMIDKIDTNQLEKDFNIEINSPTLKKVRDWLFG